MLFGWKKKKTCKRRKYPSVVKCRGKIKLTAVNYRGKPQQLTAEACWT